MPSAGYLASIVVIAATITLALRAAPFAVMSRLRSSALVAHLGRHLPAGAMLILVAYLLRDLPIDQPLPLLREIVPVLITAGMQVWRHNALLSMLVGTGSYATASAVIPPL